jgi:phage/plasmid-associated DNA primase
MTTLDLPKLKIEDLTKATGRREYVNPITGVSETDPSTGMTTVPKLTISPTKASVAIIKSMPLKISSTDKEDKPKIWWFNGEIWQSDGERKVRNLIDATIGDLSYEKGLNETMRRIRGLTDTVAFDGNPFLLPALDGVVDLQTGVIRGFSPDDLLTFKYGAPINHPGADFRPILWFLCSSLPDERDVLTAIDVIVSVFIRVSFEAFILLIGPGGNGKGILEKLMIALATQSRVSAIPLSEAKGSNFGAGNLLGKDLWILSEVEDVKKTINLLKKVSTGEFIDSDQKYQGRIQGKPHVLTILDSNKAFDFGDDSWGRKRRFVKLDFPFTFEDGPDNRPKDPHLEETLTSSPAVLSGIMQIIAARGPALCASRKIYTRKRAEEMNAEYERQQNSVQNFCNECLSTSCPSEGEQQRLRTDIMQTEYEEYCRLFNVPVPASNIQISRYISDKYNIQSKNTSETVEKKKVDYRYYPGLYLVKSAKEAYEEFKSSYDANDTPTTDLRQIWLEENDSDDNITTSTTEKLQLEVIEEIERMFKYINGCKNPQDISYEKYLENGVVSVVDVVMDHCMSVSSTT